MINYFVNSVSISSSLLAAYYWFKSGTVKFPEVINVGYGGSGGTIDELGKALVKQGRLNCYGAIAASVSACAQLTSLVLSG
jgi:hypothetical protein